jgi:hypothetical protein
MATDMHGNPIRLRNRSRDRTSPRPQITMGLTDSAPASVELLPASSSVTTLTQTVSLLSTQLQNAQASLTTQVYDQQQTIIQQSAAIAAAITTLGTPLATANIWNADQYFKSGRPWYDVIAFGADPSGNTDSTSAIQAAITAADTNGGIVWIPVGTYNCTGQLTSTGSKSVTLMGPFSSETGGGSSGASLRYSGSASAFIVANSNAGFQIIGLQILVTNASFTGSIIDLRNVSGYDSAFWKVQGCLIGGSGSGINGLCGINLDKANSGIVEECDFEGTTYGVNGRASSSSYSNANTIRNCQFVDLGTAGIHNPDIAWVIEGNTFENLSNNGAGGIYCDSSVGTYGTMITGNYFGDATVATGSPINISGGGFTISGNYIGFCAGMTAVIIGNSSIGFKITGNRFDNGGGTGTTAISLGTSCSSYDLTGNGAPAGLPNVLNSDLHVPTSGTPASQNFLAWTYDLAGGGTFNAPAAGVWTAGTVFFAELPVSGYAAVQTPNGYVSFGYYLVGTGGAGAYIGLYGQNSAGTTLTQLGSSTSDFSGSSTGPYRLSIGYTTPLNAYPRYFVAFLMTTQSSTNNCGLIIGQQSQAWVGRNAGWSSSSVPARYMYYSTGSQTSLLSSYTVTGNFTANYQCPFVAFD